MTQMDISEDTTPRQSLLRALGSAAFWPLLIAITACASMAITVAGIGLSLVDRRRFLAHWLATIWGHVIVACNPFWRLSITGREHLHPRTPYVLVANHQSQLDIMAIYFLRRQFKWVVKESLFKIPILGWALASAGYIKLRRGQHRSIRTSYEQARQWLSVGVSVFFFVEGTRSLTGQLGPFKNGAFKLALETGTTLVPVVIEGTRDLLARGSWIFHPHGRIVVTILPPIDPSRYQQEGVVALRDTVRELMRQTLHPSSPTPPPAREEGPSGSP